MSKESEAFDLQATTQPLRLFGSRLSPFSLKTECAFLATRTPYRWTHDHPTVSQLSQALHITAVKNGLLPLSMPHDYDPRFDEFPLVPFVLTAEGHAAFDSGAVARAVTRYEDGGDGPGDKTETWSRAQRYLVERVKSHNAAFSSDASKRDQLINTTSADSQRNNGDHDGERVNGEGLNARQEATRFVARFLEEFADEWVLYLLHHKRWSTHGNNAAGASAGHWLVWREFGADAIAHLRDVSETAGETARGNIDPFQGSRASCGSSRKSKKRKPNFATALVLQFIPPIILTVGRFVASFMLSCARVVVRILCAIAFSILHGGAVPLLSFALDRAVLFFDARQTRRAAYLFSVAAEGTRPQTDGGHLNPPPVMAGFPETVTMLDESWVTLFNALEQLFERRISQQHGAPQLPKHGDADDVHVDRADTDRSRGDDVGEQHDNTVEDQRRGCALERRRSSGTGRYARRTSSQRSSSARGSGPGTPRGVQNNVGGVRDGMTASSIQSRGVDDDHSEAPVTAPTLHLRGAATPDRRTGTPTMGRATPLRGTGSLNSALVGKTPISLRPQREHARDMNKNRSCDNESQENTPRAGREHGSRVENTSWISAATDTSADGPFGPFADCRSDVMTPSQLPVQSYAPPPPPPRTTDDSRRACDGQKTVPGGLFSPSRFTVADAAFVGPLLSALVVDTAVSVEMARRWPLAVAWLRQWDTTDGRCINDLPPAGLDASQAKNTAAASGGRVNGTSSHCVMNEQDDDANDDVADVDLASLEPVVVEAFATFVPLMVANEDAFISAIAHSQATPAPLTGASSSAMQRALNTLTTLLTCALAFVCRVLWSVCFGRPSFAATSDRRDHEPASRRALEFDKSSFNEKGYDRRVNLFDGTIHGRPYRTVVKTFQVKVWAKLRVEYDDLSAAAKAHLSTEVNAPWHELSTHIR